MRIMRKPTIFIVVTTYQTYLAFLSTLLAPLTPYYTFYIISNLSPLSDSDITSLNRSSSFNFIHIPFSRSITPFLDLSTLFKFIFLLFLKRPLIIHSITPKAGLISGLSSLFLPFICHIHTFTGQVWVTKTGFLHFILKFSDKLISLSSNYVLADSQSQANFLQSSGICPHPRVLGNGSISGVDTSKFFPNSIARHQIRLKLSIPSDSFVFLFVGRLTYDKGILDLVSAFSRILLSTPNAHLIFVGPDEDDIIKSIGYDPQYFHFVGPQQCPQDFMNASDVFCLPSYREGFGTSIIEAAACSVPAIGSNIYGITDAIADCYSGLLHKRGDIDDLYFHMNLLLNNPSFLSYLSTNAYTRATKLYRSDLLSSHLDSFYTGLLID
jgi:glycosyltransferase involved in cell wall biosynthesis